MGKSILASTTGSFYQVLVQSRTQSNACARARMALALGKLTTGTPKFRGSGFVGMHVKPITAQEKFNFPRANAILARAQALLWVREWFWYVQSAGCTSQDGVIDDESLVKTRTNTCLSYASAIPSYSVLWSKLFTKSGHTSVFVVEGRRLALFSIQQTDMTSFSEEGRGVTTNGYVTNPNPTPTLTPTLTPNPNRNSNPNRINRKIKNRL